MKKVIVKFKNEIISIATLEDPTEWVAKQIQKESWGKPDRWLLFVETDGIQIGHTDSRPYSGDPSKTEYFYPQEYMFLDENEVQHKEPYYIDITVEVQKEAGINYAQKAIEHGKRVIALMGYLNRNKTTAQVLTIAQTYSPIKSLLEGGALVTTIEEINKLAPDGVNITQAEKDEILAEIAKF